MIRFTLLLLALTTLITNRAQAQIFYEAPRSQYGDQNPYYYGGDDARMHQLANVGTDASRGFGRVNGFEFVGPRGVVVRQQPRVYIDGFGYQNAAELWGATPNDAYNDRLASMPTYWKKSDLLASAVVRDGVKIVPASSPNVQPARSTGTIEIRPYDPRKRRGPLLIIPKSRLDQPLISSPPQPQASWRDETRACMTHS
ncbi:MAG TPA: hypothetical protein PK402_10265 [Tepidisphaeraceae bacterium]|nr:hypothetical protein [Tepidisphaeraceae bacterium]